MPFREQFDCLWCGTAHVCRGAGRPGGLGAALPGLRRQGGRQRVPPVSPAPGADRARRPRERDAGDAADRRPRPPRHRRRRVAVPLTPDARPTRRRRPRMVAYYEARAPEYDDWYLRRGRYARGPIHDAAWNAELDAAGRWLDALPIGGEIVELAAGNRLVVAAARVEGRAVAVRRRAARRSTARATARRPWTARAPPRPRRVGGAGPRRWTRCSRGSG